MNTGNCCMHIWTTKWSSNTFDVDFQSRPKCICELLAKFWKCGLCELCGFRFWTFRENRHYCLNKQSSELRFDMGVELCYKGWITKPFFKENGLVILKTKDNLRTVSDGCASYRAVLFVTSKTATSSWAAYRYLCIYYDGLLISKC